MKTLKHILTLLIIALATFSVNAETKKVGKYTINLIPTKADAIYTVGETAEFKLTVKKDGTDFSGADITY